MKLKTLILAIVLFCLIPFASAISSHSCDTFSVALRGDFVKTDVSGNGNSIAVGGLNGMIGSFTPDGSPRWVYRTSDPVTGIATSDDGRFIAASTFYGDLFYFDEKGFLLWNRSEFGCNSQVALFGDGQEGYVFSRSPTRDFTRDTVFHFTGNGTVLSRLPVPAPTSYALSTDGRVAIVNSGGTQGRNSVVAIDDDGIRWQKISPNPWRVPLVAVSDDCNTIAAAEPGQLTAFNCHGRELWNTSTKYIARSVTVSGDGQYILAGTQYQVVNFNRSGSLVWEYPLPDYAGRIEASQDGSRIVATTRQTLYYLDMDGTALWQYHLPDWTECLSMSDKGDVITAGTYNNTFTIFDGTGRAREISLDTIPVMPIEMAGRAFSISITPIGDHSIGEIIRISGSTNLPVNTTLWISAGPKTFTNYPPNYFDGQVEVFPGPKGNHWSVILNTSLFRAEEYSLMVYPVKSTFPSCETTFNMTPRRDVIPPATISRLAITPDSYAPQQVQNDTMNLGHSSPTHPSPASVEILLGTLGIAVIFTLASKKKTGCRKDC